MLLLLSVSAVAAGQALLPPDGRSAVAPETTQIMNGAAGPPCRAATDRSAADRRCRPENGREKSFGGSLISLDPVALWQGHRDDLLLIGFVVLLLAGIFGGYTLAVRRAARRAMRFYRALPGRIGVCGRRGEILFSQSDGRVEDYRRIEELPDVDAVKFRAAVDAVLADGRERTIDYECNGVKRSVTFSPLDAGLFGEHSVIWSANDNTELQDARRKAEELAAQLRKNTRMWDIVINSLPICIYAKDVDNNYRYVFANRNTHSFFRRAEGGVVGSDDFQIFPKNVASALRRDDEEAMTSPGAALEKMFRFRRDDGAPVVCKIIRRPFLDCDGTRLLLGAAIDVSELEVAIQSAQDSSERFLLILRSIGDAVIATDRDGAGQVIRGHLKGLLPAEKIACVYTPPVKGKEKRKKAPSAEGLLGVEGTDADVLYRLFEPYFSGGAPKNKMELTRARFAELGFSGGENSQAKRAALLRAARLPANMSSKAMVEALNMLYTEEEFEKLVETMAERWTSNGGAMDER